MIDGYDALPAASKNGNAIESLARHCSVLLRKMALGDERNSRLLSDDICKEAGLSLGRIRKVPPERETLAPIDVKLTKSRTHLTLRHLENNDLLGDETFFAGPWHFRIDVEWPLPGMVDWPSRLTQESCGVLAPEGLFTSRTILSCADWVGQQLLVCGNRTLSLGDVIRLTANIDGAHSPVMAPRIPAGVERDIRADRAERENMLWVLSCIAVSGLRYTHVITTLAALHLYSALIECGLSGNPDNVGHIPLFMLSYRNLPDLDCSVISFKGNTPLPIRGTGEIIYSFRGTR